MAWLNEYAANWKPAITNTECGPAFWDTYQQVLDRLVPQGTERTEFTNEMALIIEQLGIVRRAQLVPPHADGPR